MPLPTLTIIGAGRVGQTLGKLFHTTQCFSINGVLNKHQANAEKAVHFIGTGTAYSTLVDLPTSDVCMITTPDSEIVNIAQALSQTIINKQAIVFHCSGAIPSTALSPLLEKGIKIASVHPFMTFATPEASVNHFARTPCAFEGDSTAFEILQQAFSMIGGVVFSISTEKKAIYHAANVMTCNYLIALMDIAADMYGESGLSKDQAFSIMQPIVHKTIENVFTLGAVNALTGPIARGDTDTIQLHMDAIKNPSIRHLYRLLGEKTIALSAQKGDTTHENLNKIKQILHISE